MSDYVNISASTLRLALSTYTSELLDLSRKFPEVYPYEVIGPRIAEIDRALLTIEGNVTSVNISPATCNPNR